MSSLYILTFSVYELSNPAYPSTEHRFYGRTRIEAEKYFKMHLESDSFVKKMVSSKPYKGYVITSNWNMLPWSRS